MPYVVIAQEVCPNVIIGGHTIQDPTNCNRFEITDNGNAQMGYLWNATKVNLKNDFYVSTFMTFGTKDANGADGIAFSLQPVSNEEGATGEGLGVEGVSPLFGVEYDTYQNGAKNDPSYDHMSFFSHATGLNHNGVSYTNPTQIVAGQNNVENGQWYAMKFHWNSQTQTFTVFDGCDVRMSTQIDLITDIFSGDSMVFWGFTASTGGKSNIHQVELEFAHFGLNDTLMCKNDTITPNIVVNTNSNYVYHWSPAQGVSDTTALNPLITTDTTTTYYLTVYNECGVLVVTDSIEISVKPDPNPFDVNIPEVFCTADSVLASITEGIPNYDYAWIIGNDMTQGTSTYIPFGDSVVVQTVGLTPYGCALNQNKTIYAELPATDFTITTSNDTLCPSDSLTVNVTGTNIGDWTPTIYNKQGDTINAYQASFYIDSSQFVGVNLVSQHGCTYQDSSFIFKVILQPVVDVVDSICIGESVTLNVLGVDVSNWLGLGNGTITFAPDSSFEYEIVVSELGCVDTLKEWITVLPLPEVNITMDQPMIVCDGEEVTIPIQNVATGFSLITYVWDGLLPETITATGDTVISKTVNHQGNPNELHQAQMQITSVVDAFGCVANILDDAMVNIAPLPQITSVVPSSVLVCDGDTVAIEVETTGIGSLVYNYSFDGGNTTNTHQQLLGNINLPMIHVDGNNERSVIEVGFVSIVDSLGCASPANDIVTIEVNPLPQFFNLVQNQNEFCDGDTLLVGYSLSGFGNLSLDYQADGNAANTITGLKAVSVTKAMTHVGDANALSSYELVFNQVSDSLGCTTQMNDLVVAQTRPIPQLSNFSIDKTQVCDGEEVNLQYDVTGAGVLSVTEVWNGNDSLVNNNAGIVAKTMQMQHQANANEQDVYTFGLQQVSDVFGCQSTVNELQEVSVNPLPQFFNLVQNQNEFCDGDTLLVGYSLSGFGNLSLDYQEDGNAANTITGLKAVSVDKAMTHVGDANALSQYELVFNQVSDSLGCTTQMNDSVVAQIRPIPQLSNFSIDKAQVCDGEEVNMQYDVTGVGVLQVTELLNGIDSLVNNNAGLIANTLTLIHQADANEQEVYAFGLQQVSDAFGCQSTVNELQKVSINPLPQFFNLAQNQNEFCDGDTLLVNYDLSGFGNLSLDYQENGITANEVTGLKAISVNKAMTHVGDANALSSYELVFNQVTDSLGCTTTVNDSVEVSIRPIPSVISFETDQNKVCNNTAVEVSSSFSGVGTLLVDFGIDNSFTSKTISQLAFDTTLTLTHTGNENEVSNYALQVAGVADSFGCSSAINMVQDVIVHPTPSYKNVSLNKTAYCENDTILFEANYSGIAPFQVAFNRSDSLIQLSGNTLSNSTNWEASHELSNKNEQQTVQIAMLTIQDSLGCLGTTNPSVTYTVNPTPDMAWKQLTNHAFCDGDSLLLSAELTGVGNLLAGIDNANMQAIAGDLNIPMLASHVGNQNEVGVQAFTLLNIEDELGCSNTTNDTLKIRVNPLPSVNAFETNKNHVCEGESVNLAYELTGVLPLDVTTSEFGNTVVNQVEEYQNTFAKQLFHFGNPNQTNQYDFFITAVVDSLGCTKEINEQTSVIVNPLPKITAIGFNDDEICSGDNTQLNFTTTGVALNSMEININNVDTIINNPLYTDSFQVNFIHQGNNNAKHLLAVSALEIIDSLGCFTNSSIVDSIAIRPLPQITNSVLSNMHVCDGDSVMLFTEVTGMLPLHVIYNEGTDSLYLSDYIGTQVFEAKHQAEQSNYDTLFINTNSIVDDFGCASVMNTEQMVLVNPTPQMVQSNVNDSMFCDGDELLLNATFTGIMPLSMTYTNWNGNNGDWVLNNSELYLNTVAAHDGSNDSLSRQQFSMYQITDELGCNAILNDVSEILVRPLPSIEQVLFDKEAYCEGDSMLLSIVAKGVGLLAIETNSVLNEVYSGLNEQKMLAEHTVEKLQKDTLQFVFGAITDDFGCSSVNGINKLVTINPTPGITSFEFTDSWVCENDEVELQVSAQGIMPLLVNINEQGQDAALALNNPTFSHRWVAKHQGDKNKSAISKLTAIEVSDELGCKAELAQVAQLMVNPLPTFTNAFDDSLSFCDNGSLAITNLSTGVLPLQFDYEYNNVAEQLLMQTHEFDLSQNMQYIGSGDEVAVQNVVWKSITDSLGCKSTINEVSNISIYPNPTVQIAPTKNMWCESDTIDWLYEVKGIGNFSLEYLLNDLNQDLVGVAKQGVIRQAKPLNGVNNLNMTHVVDNAFGCSTNVSEMDSVQVFLNPQVDFSGEANVCEGDEVSIQFKGVKHADNFTMLIDNVLYSGLDSSSNLIIQAIADTVIHFQQVINDEAPNCSTALNQSFYKINVQEAPKVAYTLPEQACENDMVTLQLINTSEYDKINVSYLINGDSSAVELKSKAIDKTFRIKENTTVIIQSAIGTSALQCLKTYNDTLFIKKLELPNALFEINPAVVDVENREAQVFNKSFRAVHYDWDLDYGVQQMNDDKENPVFKFPDEAGEYEVGLLVTAENGCEDEIKRIVVVKDKLLVFVPNAFTPNGDNYNAIFKPVLNHDDLVYYEFQVYNRWGELIYETVQTTEGWDGTYAGEQVPDGVYAWTVNARLRGDAMELVNKEGKVTIIR